MARYYYDKYNVQTEWREPPPKKGSDDRRSLAGCSKTATWDKVGKRWIPEGRWDEKEYVYPGAVGYFFNSYTYPIKYVVIYSNIAAMNYVDVEVYYMNSTDATASGESRGTLVQSGIPANEGAYPYNGKHTDGYWYVRQSARAPSPPNTITLSKTNDLSVGEEITVSWSGASDFEGELISHFLEARLNGGNWTTVATKNTSSGSSNHNYTIPESTSSIQFRVRVRDAQGLYSSYKETTTYSVTSNSPPTINLTTSSDQTLYENDTFTISGSALDSDNGDIVNIKYQINSGTARAIKTDISDGTTPITFNRQLLFKGGQLFDGATAVTGALADGTAHSLKVWSEDDQGEKSTVEERTFYVVPNRPPVLTVDPFTSQSDLISNDKITIKGTSSDPDGNDVVVSYKLNSGLATQIHSGPTGTWTFDLQLKQLKDGENTIIIEVIDTYDFKTSKTIKLNKHMHLTPLSQSIQRYKIIPPAGSAEGVLLWIQRDLNQVVSAEISMTTGAEQEQFVPITLTNTAPVSVDVVEDEFTFQSDSAKENIVLKIITNGDKPITLISGVLS